MRAETDHAVLFSLDTASGAEKVVGSTDLENAPRSNLSPSLRLSLAPDGKTFTYGTIAVKDNLWLLEGFAAKRGLFAGLGFHKQM